jgi:hypothetical protein
MAINSTLDHELICARSLALWMMRDDGLNQRQVDYQLRRARYVAKHRRDAIRYAARRLKDLRILVSLERGSDDLPAAPGR